MNPRSTDHRLPTTGQQAGASLRGLHPNRIALAGPGGQGRQLRPTLAVHARATISQVALHVQLGPGPRIQTPSLAGAVQSNAGNPEPYQTLTMASACEGSGLPPLHYQAFEKALTV
jgi:hypothetical protein